MGQFLFISYICMVVSIFIVGIQYISFQNEYKTKKEYIKAIFILFILALLFPVTIIVILINNKKGVFKWKYYYYTY